ncbi:hypothetical protein BpHYR1_000511 [Brachionus plicatilis]|uniref:Uncharacterized protein n=1 Tax=Brachionus plicatilis TaxID=10195 RepID=A0A3M7PEB6_BRAPC|nr:hypothetical protein BpHYR1_000511 [Brachionus plicatilis]
MWKFIKFAKSNFPKFH